MRRRGRFGRAPVPYRSGLRAVASDATGSRPAPASDRRADPGARSGRPVQGAAAPADGRGVFVEGVRLFVVLLGTAAGFWVARDLGSESESASRR